MAETLETLLKQDFAHSESGRPAELEIKPLYKKYPFHEQGHEFRLGFVIENQGPGHAREVKSSITVASDNIEVRRSTLRLGRLEPGSIITDFPARVTAPETIALAEVVLSWRNPDGGEVSSTCSFEFESQRTDIDWDDLELEDPYSLEPVEMHDDLVGRREILNQLIRQSRARSVGSCYIFGQKRVGKTSIAKALRSRLDQHEHFLPIYLEGGEYVHPDPTVTLSQLGTKLCTKITKGDSRLADLSMPSFEGALSPITDFLEDVTEILPDLRIVIILDEFDELPIDLYRRGPLADAFFLTLRTISGKPPYGLVLVGGEKMEFIMSCQGDALNKFHAIPVDYFDRKEHWTDFQALIRKPTQDWFEITDEAIVALHEQTAGNPYYTMVICRQLFAMMLHRRDCHMTKREVEEAVQLTLQSLQSNAFQHFWEDGIFESEGSRVEEISMRRRRILIALTNILRKESKASRDDIAAQDEIYADVDFLDSELRRFVQRRVLVEETGLYDCKVPIFRAWLTHNGVSAILTTFSDLDAIMERKRREEQVYVQSGEIVDVVSTWGLYQGRRISEEQVRAWLNQFGDYTNQRLMFKVLKGLRFYTDDLMREKMKEAHGIVSRGLVWDLARRQRKRGDILVSYVDGPGKSGGGKYCKLYVDENNIYAENVVDQSKLVEAVYKRKDLRGLVFIDDFIGTGRSARKGLEWLARKCGQILRESDLKIYFVAVTGFQEGQAAIEEMIEELALPVQVHICDPLDTSAKCFGNDSQLFNDKAERLQAMRVAQEHGARLVKRGALGYGGCQSAVVFSSSCPNNNLPILWAESDELPWHALFRRPMRQG
jgi:hypothetical protein